MRQRTPVPLCSCLRRPPWPKKPLLIPPPNQQVGAELGALLAELQRAHPKGPEDFAKAAAEDVAEAFTGAAFDPALLAAGRSSVSARAGGTSKRKRGIRGRGKPSKHI